MNILKGDRVVAISGHFKNKRGYVCRIENNAACVVWKNVWDHGIWVDLKELKRTKRYKQERLQ